MRPVQSPTLDKLGRRCRTARRRISFVIPSSNDAVILMKTRRVAWVGGLFLAVCIPSLSFAQRISCESREYERSYCSTGTQVNRAWLISQSSASPCIQGRTWGYDRGGIWVNSGCAGDFGFQGGRPAAATVVCESREYRRNFCGIAGGVSRVWMVEQRSQAPCIEGQTWGSRGDGVWVNRGCAGVFAFDSR